MTMVIACVTTVLWILWRFLLARTTFHRQPHLFSLKAVSTGFLYVNFRMRNICCTSNSAVIH